MIDWVIRIGAGLLLLVTVAFAFVGFLHVTRGTPVHRVRAPGDDGPPAVRDRLFCDTIAMLTKSHLTSGHRIEVMTTPATCDLRPNGYWEALGVPRVLGRRSQV